ncbi:hypothetical protein [Sphaerothrix gracilis]|uniref:hypothetical protein n=1 Tax=Sphaerothrix gracilis TaxID=3151835 RepID=UPI0031FBFF40
MSGQKTPINIQAIIDAASAEAVAASPIRLTAYAEYAVASATLSNAVNIASVVKNAVGKFTFNFTDNQSGDYAEMVSYRGTNITDYTYTNKGEGSITIEFFNENASPLEYVDPDSITITTIDKGLGGTGSAPLSFTQSISSGQTDDGVSLTATAGDTLEFNLSTASGDLPARTDLYIGGSQVGAIDLPTRYLGKQFRFTLNSSGASYLGSFADGTVNLVAEA